ncbi:MAG: diaminohydroxyphosphoribosylaminopyrimidine deaminase [Blastocatellia bacterium]
MSELDEQFMKRALELARRGTGLVSPNPAVGAVVVRDGRVVGEGFFLYEHLKHAEVYALEQAGEQARGATLYCSLEPCCFQGRTPPCTDAVIEAGIARAVIAVADPHSRVRGRGLEQLRDAGIVVEVGLLEAESQRINEAFFKFAQTGLPFIHAVRVEAIEQTVRAWIPSTKFLETATEYDAILLESLSAATLNILQSSFARHRHRPLIIAGARAVLQRAGARLPTMNDREKASTIELARIAPASESLADQQILAARLLAPLAELRAVSVLVLAASTKASPLVHAADKVTCIVDAAGSADQQQAIAREMQAVVITESPGFKEFTGYPRYRDEK